MKVLAITNLFANSRQPERGIFNTQQFVELAKICELQVVAPLPWFPKMKTTDKRAIFSEIPEEETMEGIKTYHPRYFLIPKIGRSLYGFLFYFGIINKVKEIYKKFPFDVIVGTWAYPDAFAAALVAKKMDKPLVVKVHGSDVNVMTNYFLRRKMIKFAFNRAFKITPVSYPLKDKIVSLGIPAAKVETIENGMNVTMFKKMDKKECRQTLGLGSDKKHVVYVGNLVPIKGIQFLVEAFKYLPKDVTLSVVGDGELRPELEANVKRWQLEDRVYFFGRLPHDKIPYWLNAADIFCLPTLNEGCPNVILEAIACGTPIVATRIGPIPEMVSSPQSGEVVNPGDPKALADGIQRVLNRSVGINPAPYKILSWQENARKFFTILEKAAKA